MAKKKIIAIDPGNHNLKASHNGKVVIKPNAVGVYPYTNIEQVNDFSEFIPVENGFFVIGETAIEMLSQPTSLEDHETKYNHQHFLLSILGTIVPLLEDGTQEVTLVYGLPMYLMENDNTQISIRDILVGTHTFQTLANKYTVIISDVVFKAQPYGTIYSFAYSLDESGKLKENKDYIKIIKDSTMLVVDIGGGTTDCFIARGGSLSHLLSLSVIGGVNQVYSRINQYLKNNQLSLNKKQLEKAIKAGYATNFTSKKKIFIEEEVNRLTSQLWNTIFSELAAKFGDELNSVENVVLTGGGANLLAQEVEKFRNDYKVGTVTSNVEGLYIYGLLNI